MVPAPSRAGNDQHPYSFAGDLTTMRRRYKPGEIPRPTEAELAILNVLWELGPSTVRSVHQAMEGHHTGYTTILKLLQIMYRKGLVRRDDSQRAHVYDPAFSKDETQQQLTRDLVQRAFDGSASQLVLQALGNNPRTTPKELQEIREVLARLEDSRSS